ncbi:DUF6042 family protein [Streptomyces sp. bgisy084]
MTSQDRETGAQEQADAERLEVHQRFRLVMNWDHFHETRMRLSAEPATSD